jgi:hypothetical protein
LTFSIFQVALVVFTLFQANTSAAVAAAGQPDFSTTSANFEIAFFVPGVTASLMVFLVFGTAKPWSQYRKLIQGAFGIKRWMEERRKKAAIGVQSRDFEFDRLPSLRNQPSEDDLTRKSELADRVRMFSIYDEADETVRPPTTTDIFAGDRRDYNPGGLQFHQPHISDSVHIQKPDRVAHGPDSHLHNQHVDYESITRKQDFDSRSMDSKMFVGYRVAQRSPEAYLEDSSD